MAKIVCFVMLLMIITTTFNVLTTNANDELLIKTYIVHLDTHPQGQEYLDSVSDINLNEWYYSFLSKMALKFPSKDTQPPEMVHSYRHVVTGFAAKMTADQAKAILNVKGVLAVQPNGVHKLHTTRSPDFLGLRTNLSGGGGLWSHSNKGKGVIIGVLDSGITPGHPSFNDDGMPPPPQKWKGKCEIDGCNNKLIGMRSFINGSTPKDVDGHGTHTSSTAAGTPVDDANVYGQANGTASGMAPLAHLAMYKVCQYNSCPFGTILAGMDAAIEDGVDVISISLGGFPFPFYSNPVTYGGFRAIQKGVFVSCSAGNAGPDVSSVTNDAPWLLTVGASTQDRRFRTSIVLGGGNDTKLLLHGESLYQPEEEDAFDQTQPHPLVYPAQESFNELASFCLEGSFRDVDVKGKLVLCDSGQNSYVEKGEAVRNAGGAGVIIANEEKIGQSTVALKYVIPASNVGYKQGMEIKNYLKNSTSSPVASLVFFGTINDLKSKNPQVISFSSRGPSVASPGILKPDVIGPGANIIAAWPSSAAADPAYDIISGTSMACPHLSGVAALLKSDHPDWSTAAIKSAILTTASQVDHNNSPIVDEQDNIADVLALGSGHVNPSKATDPGLVFDIQPDDYVPYLCGLGYTPEQLQIIVSKPVTCSKTITEGQLNVPSFVVNLKKGDTVTYTRTVTNVGNPNSSYTIRDVSVPNGITLEIHTDQGTTTTTNKQQQLTLTEMYQKLRYHVKFIRDQNDDDKPTHAQGHMTWVSDNMYTTVRTPFFFRFK